LFSFQKSKKRGKAREEERSKKANKRKKLKVIRVYKGISKRG